MISFPLLCEAGYGNLGDDLSVALLRDLFRELVGHNAELWPVTMGQSAGLMPPYEFMAFIGPGTLLAPNTGEWNKIFARQVDRGWRFSTLGTGIADPKDFGTSKAGMHLLGRFLHCAPLLWLRGPRSMTIAKEAMDYYCKKTDAAIYNGQIRIVGDPISLIYKRPTVEHVTIDQARKTFNKVLINFGYTAYCRGSWDRLLSNLAKTCDLIREELKLNPVLWPIWARHDIWPLRALKDKANLKDVEFISSVDKLNRIVKSAIGSVCFRLHAGLFSLACDVPSVMIAYQEKIHDACDPIGWLYRVDPLEKNFPEKTVELLKEAIRNDNELIEINQQCYHLNITMRKNLSSFLNRMLKKQEEKYVSGK